MAVTLVGFAMLAGPGLVESAGAAAFNVTGTADSVAACSGSSCPSLRSAVLASNAAGGTNTISVPAGQYTLTRTPSGSDDAHTGDLNITANVTITGAGPGKNPTDPSNTTITGKEDRIFDITAKTVTLSGLDMTHGGVPSSASSSDGGAVLDEGDSASLTLTNDLFDASTTGSGGAGGGVGMETTGSGNLKITNSLFEGNLAANPGSSGGGLGGAVDFEPETSGTLMVTDSGFADNTAESGTTSGGGFGGGISFQPGDTGTLTITGSRFARNAANGSTGSGDGGFGGGIDFEPGNSPSSMSVTNSTFNGNSAGGSSPFGGAVNFEPNTGDTGTLTHVTIVGNSTSVANRGGGVYVEFAPLTVRNSIISGNTKGTSGNNCFVDSTPGSALIPQGHNIELGKSCGFDINKDPKVLGMGNYGGPTETMALKAASPALNTATTIASVKTDQRGGPRPQPAGDAPDIGAYERGSLVDSAITKTGSPNPATIGRTITYKLKVTNTGPSPDPVFNQKVTDHLPPGVTLKSTTPSQNSCAHTSSTVTCDLGTIDKGASATVTIKVTPKKAGSVTNTATISSDAKDPNSANNSASVTTKVKQAKKPHHHPKPVAITEGASNVISNAATLHGKVNPKGAPTTYLFQFGRTRHYGSQTSSSSAGSGNSPESVSQRASGLKPGTLYHYRIVAKNAHGTATGGDRTFRTPSSRGFTG